MVSENCGSSLLLALPDDVFAIVSRSLSLKDICNLSLCCRSLSTLAASDKVWLMQCDMLEIVPPRDLIEWRKAMYSYKALCRFLVGVRPLIGIWVHQNPELGNLVYVMPGFVSVVGCRVIPQELGPLGIEEGPILWAPVFEIMANSDGCSTTFFLHGREKGTDYFYPGSLKAIETTCNVLLLEVEPRQQKIGGKLTYSKTAAHCSDKVLSRRVCRSDKIVSQSQRICGENAPMVSFSRLIFGDRRKLLEIVTSKVRLKVPNAANRLMFPQVRDDDQKFQKDVKLLFERRLMLTQISKLGGIHINWKVAHELSDHNKMESTGTRRSLDHSSGFHNSLIGDDADSQRTKKKTLGGYFRDGLKHIMRKSSSINGRRLLLKNSSLSSENKHAQLNDFLRSSDTVGLTLHASAVKLSSYRAWPNMHDSRFALYKLPMQVPTVNKEYSGLWGGTFGWPPGRPTEDKPAKALFFLLLSYEESQGQRLLIATKILEGTHYVLHPNGSAMFIVNMDEPSLEPFPWDTDIDSLPVNVNHAFMGEGIANGYGFRYPGSKPGSLFIIGNGLLAFIWKETRAVLTLQRLDLQELLKKGERVAALPPIANFSYLTKSYSNVFAGFSSTSTCLSSPRFSISH